MKNYITQGRKNARAAAMYQLVKSSSTNQSVPAFEDAEAADELTVELILLAEGIVPCNEATPVNVVEVLAVLRALLPDTAALVVPV